MHLTDGQLRAYLDGEQVEAQGQHLAGCPACQARLAEVRARAQSIRGRLAFLASSADDHAPAARAALSQFRQSKLKQKETSVFKRMFERRFRPAWGLVTALALVAALLTLAPVRAWAGQFLGLFRVQQVTVLPVDTTRLSDLAGDEALGHQIGQLMADSFTVVREPSPPSEVGSAAEASALAGFGVRLPEGAFPTPLLTVQDGAAFEMVVNRERAQALLQEMGHADLRLPASLDGATIAVDIPAAVSAAFGDCPRPRAGDEPEAESMPWSRLRTCVILAQMPSPTVTAPPDLDVGALAEIGLQVMGMSPEEARAFSQTVDWTSTLVIPIPRYGHTYEQVEVDGVTGNAIYRRGDDGVPARYALVWVKDGIIYGLSGFGSPASGTAMANALK